MQFRYPYQYPPFNPGIQITNLQQGGPSSHMELRPFAPRVYPIVLEGVKTGLGNMPRQVFGPSRAVNVNAVSNPPQSLLIKHLQKNP